LQDGFQFAFRFAIGYIPLLAFAYLVPEYRDALDPDQNGCRWITLAYTILWLGTNRCAVSIFLFLPMVGPSGWGLMPSPAHVLSYESLLNKAMLRVAGTLVGCILIFAVMSVSTEAVVLLPCTAFVVFVLMFVQPESRSRLFQTPDALAYFFTVIGTTYGLIFSKACMWPAQSAVLGYLLPINWSPWPQSAASDLHPGVFALSRAIAQIFGCTLAVLIAVVIFPRSVASICRAHMCAATAELSHITSMLEGVVQAGGWVGASIGIVDPSAFGPPTLARGPCPLAWFLGCTRQGRGYCSVRAHMPGAAIT
jgi:hypothetical protein